MHYLSISLSHPTAVARTPPPHPLSPASGGLGPDGAEKGSTAVLSLWLAAPSPPPHIMNNGTEKYICLLIAPAPLAETVQYGPNRHSAGLRFLRTPPFLTSPPLPSPHYNPPVIVSAPFEVGCFLVS